MRVPLANGVAMSVRPESASVAPPQVLVWDWPLRVFHWTLVVAIATSFATHYLGIEWFDWHRRAGYVALVLIAFRVVWGVVGPRYARFKSFLHGPRAILDYVRGVRPHAPAGHNPLGGLSVVALVLVVALQAVTGLFANDEIANAGPFYGWITQETSNRLTAWHELNSSVLLVLIALHLVAVGWHDLVRRHGLARSMWTGRRAAGEGIASSRGMLAVGIVLALIAALALALRAAPAASVSFF